MRQTISEQCGALSEQWRRIQISPRATQFQLLPRPALKKTDAARKEKQLFGCAKIMLKNLHTNTKRPQNRSQCDDMIT